MIAEGTPGQLKASVGAGVMDVRLREFDQRSQAPRTLSHALDVPVALESDPKALSPGSPTPR
jgi:ABC-2 type transport system ATP-binding protein